MKYMRESLGSLNLHVINTKKFKTTQLAILFRRKLVKEEITKRAVLSKILMESTNRYPTGRMLEIETEREYGVSLYSSIQYYGEQSALVIQMKSLNEAYTEKGMFQKNIDLLFDILLNPHVENNSFHTEDFKVVKNIVESELKSIKDNPKNYANVRMLEEMDPDSPVSYRSGYLEDLDKINESNLYDYYKDVIQNDVVDVFVLGDVKLEEIKAMFEGKFAERQYDLESPIYHHLNYRVSVKQKTEKEKIKQAKLSIGCKIMNPTREEMNYVMPIYANILGGPTYSKLFKNVREKNSLCYYVYSNYVFRKNILMIASGINKENSEKTLELIDKDMKNMQKGKITEEELSNAKKDIISSLKMAEDDAGLMLNHYINKALYDMDEIDVRIKELNKVTVNDIKRVAKKIKMDTVFLLYGDDNNEENRD